MGPDDPGNWGSGAADCGCHRLAACAGICAAERKKLDNHSQMLTIAARRSVFRQGEIPRYFYTIASGCLRLTALLPNGRRKILGFPMPGDYFGLCAAPRYDYGASAITGSRLCRIPIGALSERVGEHRVLQRAVALRREQGLQAMRSHVLTLTRRSAQERVAVFILEYVRHAAQAAPDAVDEKPSGAAASENRSPRQVRLPMGRADIADYLGLTLETASRCFAELGRLGVIESRGGGAVRVIDREGLMRLTGG